VALLAGCLVRRPPAAQVDVPPDHAGAEQVAVPARPSPSTAAASARRDPILHDWALYQQALEQARAGDAAAVSETTRALIAFDATSVWRGRALLASGLVWQRAGQCSAARQAIAAALPDLDDSGPYWARGALALAECEVATGDHTSALATAQRLRRAGGRSVAAKRARRLTDRLARAHPTLLNDGETRLVEAELRLAEGDAAWALEASRAVEAEGAPALRARWLRARAERALGRRDEAEATCRALASDADPDLGARALLQAATWRWNADEDALARPLFQEVQRRFPDSDAAHRASYAIARIDESAGRRAVAIAAYDALAEAPAGDDLATEARWTAAFAAYMGGDWSAAAGRFGTMANGPDQSLRVAAAYWQARALDNDSDPAGNEALRHLADTEASTYYGYMAGRRLGRPQLTPVASGPIGTIPAPEFPADLSGPHAERARAFLRHGLRHAARRELDALRGLVPNSELAAAYRAVGAPGPALRLTGHGPTSDPMGYPLGYWNVVEPVARSQGVDPLLVLAVIRQESLFLPEAVSPADAHGLMQLLPRTARRVAAQVDAEPPDRWALRRIGLNVTLGTAFLRQLLERYDGSEIRTLAAYNAGPEAVAKWERRNAGRPDDEFVELISYRETRRYVKKVMSNHLAYRALYASG